MRVGLCIGLDIIGLCSRVTYTSRVVHDRNEHDRILHYRVVHYRVVCYRDVHDRAVQWGRTV